MPQGKYVARPSSDEAISSAVVTAIADLKGVDPVDLDERLYDAVDPGALDQLFPRDSEPRTTATVQVSFTMAGCTVNVRGGRQVLITLETTTTAASEAPA